MQVIFALPFVLLSIVSCVVCLAVPKLRRYVIQALIAPVAFGICSIASMGAIVLIGERFGLFTEPAIGVRGFMMMLFIFVTPGLVGAWIAVSAVGRLREKASK